MRQVDILGVRIDDITQVEVVAQVGHWLKATQATAHQIATVNPEFLMLTRHNRIFAQTLQHTALNVPDGIGILYAARLLGYLLRERVAGVDLMCALCQQAAQLQWPVFLLGARPGVAAQTATVLAARYAGLRVVGTHAGSPKPEDRAEIVSRVRATRPNLLFVAYGAPAQDIWLSETLPALVNGQPILGMGVGGSFDFITGVQQRAPDWIQRIGLEWLHRLLRDPKRWRRQLALPQFGALVMLESFRKRSRT